MNYIRLILNYKCTKITSNFNFYLPETEKSFAIQPFCDTFLLAIFCPLTFARRPPDPAINKKAYPNIVE